MLKISETMRSGTNQELTLKTLCIFLFIYFWVRRLLNSRIVNTSCANGLYHFQGISLSVVSIVNIVRLKKVTPLPKICYNNSIAERQVFLKRFSINIIESNLT